MSEDTRECFDNKIVTQYFCFFGFLSNYFSFQMNTYNSKGLHFITDMYYVIFCILIDLFLYLSFISFHLDVKNTCSQFYRHFFVHKCYLQLFYSFCICLYFSYVKDIGKKLNIFGDIDTYSQCHQHFKNSICSYFFLPKNYKQKL